MSVQENFFLESNFEIPAVINQIIQSDEGDLTKDQMFLVVEQAFIRVAESIFGTYSNIICQIGRQSGSIKLQRKLTLVEDDSEDFDEMTNIKFNSLSEENKDAKIGDKILNDLPYFKLDSSAIRLFKHCVSDLIKECKREIEFQKFSKLKGTIVNGTVKRAGYKDILVNINKTEAIISKKNLIPQEVSLYRTGSKIIALIEDVIQNPKNPQVILTRTSKEFLSQLLVQEIPEINDGTIEIRAISRDAGSRAKVAVHNPARTFDPVGACIGTRGQKINKITSIVCNERVDIIEWSDDLEKMIKSCLKGIIVNKITINEEEKSISIVVPEDMISLAIGRGGQNVWLIADILKYNINILTENEDKDKNIQLFEKLTQELMEMLDIDNTISQLLLSEGLKVPKDIIESGVVYLSNIEGFNKDIAEELISRSEDYLAAKKIDEEGEISEKESQEESQNIAKSLKIDSFFAEVLVRSGVRSVANLADLAKYELIEMLSENDTMEKLNLTESQLEKLIMQARKIAYNIK